MKNWRSNNSPFQWTDDEAGCLPLDREVENPGSHNEMFVDNDQHRNSFCLTLLICYHGFGFVSGGGGRKEKKYLSTEKNKNKFEGKPERASPTQFVLKEGNRPREGK